MALRSMINMCNVIDLTKPINPVYTYDKCGELAHQYGDLVLVGGDLEDYHRRMRTKYLTMQLLLKL